jgi:hypothetical protein
MRASLLLNQRLVLAENRFTEIVIWQLPKPVRGSAHRFKYRLAFVVDDACVLRFDNEVGKGDHKHIGTVQTPYAFTTPTQLIADFWQAVEDWRPA